MPPEKWEQIIVKLPNTAFEIHKALLLIDPQLVAICDPESERLQLSLVCLRDAAETACMMKFSLWEAFAHLRWFREEVPEAPAEADAVFWARYFADNAALRLYPAAEDIAQFVVVFLGIGGISLDSSKKTSKAAKVGKYLRREMPNDRVTHVICKLTEDRDYKETIEYRNVWVHEQPPRLRGAGIVWERKSRHEKIGDCVRVRLSLGDEPSLDIDCLLNTVSGGVRAFDTLLYSLNQMLREELKGIGIESPYP